MAKKKAEEVVPLHSFEGSSSEQFQKLYDQCFGCSKCGLHATRPGPELVFGVGNESAKVMIIGEAPGEEEERTLTPFVGPSGQLLNQMLALVADDPEIQSLSQWYDKATRSKENVRRFHTAVREWRDREFFITNVVCCKPPENRQPSNPEVKACFDRLRNMIYITDPFVIITVGKTALEALLKRTSEITKKRGQLYEVDLAGRVTSTKYVVMPILHPSYLLRKADWNVPEGDYRKTLKDIYSAMRLKDEMMLRNFGTPIPHRVVPPK
jgi:uracil-DNA glycosylase